MKKLILSNEKVSFKFFSKSSYDENKL